MIQGWIKQIQHKNINFRNTQSILVDNNRKYLYHMFISTLHTLDKSIMS